VALKDNKLALIASVFLAGATAMAAQIVFLREFLIVFYGNEISIGLILASWLFWGALGSLILGRFSDRIVNKLRVFYSLQIALSVILPAVIICIRLFKPMIGIAAGEIVGYYPMTLATLSILSAPCAILGFMFSLACRIYPEHERGGAGGVARVYGMESFGAIAGGAAASFVLVPRVDAFNIMLIFSALNLIGAITLQRFSEPHPGKAVTVTSVAALIVFLAMVLGGSNAAIKFSREGEWKGFDVVDSKDSVYGNITVTSRAGQVSFYDNGLHLYTVPDPLYAENITHLALLEHSSPRKVLLIGGGVGGLLKEILKHPVERVDYVELDPLIVKMARKYLSAKDSEVLDRPKVRVINSDGRFYVKGTLEKYDCAIIALGDPYTAQLNRFYTSDFFRELKNALNDDAVVAFALTGSANYIGDELADYVRSVVLGVKSVFPDVLVVPGDTMYILASAHPGALTADVNVLMNRLKIRGVEAQYVREYYLFDVLSAERLKYAADALDKKKSARLNTDFTPVSYYHATVFWSSQFDTPRLRRFLRSVTPSNIWLISMMLTAVAAIIAGSKFGDRGKKAVMAALFTTGFTQIIFQIAVILSFQVIYGYVFYKIGIIITAFMLGLALGSMAMARLMPRVKDDVTLFTAVQAGICVYPLMLPALFSLFSGTGSELMRWLGANIVFPFMPVIAGVIGGVEFTLANKLCISDASATGRVAGVSYGVDLLGSCIGALVAAAFLIPVLGIFQTCLLAAFMNFMVLALLLQYNRGR
jgi:spermidine synthase